MAILTKDNDLRVAELFNKFAGKVVQPTADRRKVDENDPVIVSLKDEAAKHGFSVNIYPLLDCGMTEGGQQDRLTVYCRKDENLNVCIQKLELEDYTV